jgi:hypothetical protein
MADYGIKVSETGSDVLTASEAELAFTSKYPVLKAILIGSVSLTADVQFSIAHNLGYAPAFSVFARANSDFGYYRHKIPRFIAPGESDPFGGGLTGFAYSDSTYLYIETNVTTQAFYYIFVDTL